MKPKCNVKTETIEIVTQMSTLQSKEIFWLASMKECSFPLIHAQTSHITKREIKIIMKYFFAFESLLFSAHLPFKWTEIVLKTWVW